MFSKEELVVRTDTPIAMVHYGIAELIRRAELYNPVIYTELVKNGGTLPNYARGALMTYPRAPERNHILIMKGLSAHEELIVLAHELGHADNFRYEPERWHRLQSSLKFVAIGIRPPDVMPILEEEVAANERGRTHLIDVCPHIVEEFDRQMSLALMMQCIRLESMP